MATTQNEAGLPQITLTQGMILRFNAVSATTGAAVTGVTVTNISIYGEVQDADTSGGNEAVVPPLFAYAPDTV